MLKRDTEHISDSDKQIMITLTRGDREALGTLWDRHARPVYSLAVRMLLDPGWAEEVVQDVFLGLWREPQRYDPSRGDLRRWLLTVAHHAAVDVLRGRRGTARTRDVGPEPLETLTRGGDDPSESVWRNIRAERVRAAISELPDTQREVIELVYFEGFTQAEVAQNTGQPLGTVKSRLRLGMRKMRDSLAEIGASE